MDEGSGSDSDAAAAGCFEQWGFFVILA